MHRLTITFFWPWTPEETRDIISYLFGVSLGTAAVATLMETVWPGIISYSWSVAASWWVVASVGAVYILVATPIVRQRFPTSWWDWCVFGATLAACGVIAMIMGRHSVSSWWPAIGMIVAIVASWFVGAEES